MTRTTTDSNPFAGLPAAIHPVIEKLLGDLYRSGDWTDDHEALFDQWREARGEAAKGAWSWWVGEVGGESYDQDAPDRATAIAIGMKEYGGAFLIAQARMWNDNVKDGEDIAWFAEMQNCETIQINPIDPASQAGASALAACPTPTSAGAHFSENDHD